MKRAPFYSIGLIFAAAVMSCHSRSPEVALNISDAPTLSVREVAALDGDSPASEMMLWSADGKKFARFSCAQHPAIIYAYDIATKEMLTLDTGAFLNPFATAWRPDGTSILAAVTDEAPTSSGKRFPDAQKLIEYDASTGAVVREISGETLGGFVSWAHYAPKNGRIVVTVEPDTTSLGQGNQTRRTLIIDTDGTTQEIASGNNTLIDPRWSADERFLVHKRPYMDFELPTRARRLVHKVIPRADSIVLTPIDSAKQELVIAYVPQQATSFATYSTPVLTVQYELHDTPAGNASCRWEIWEWNEATNETTLRIDLSEALQDRTVGANPFGYIWMTDDPNLVFLVNPTKQVIPPEYYVLNLKGEPRIEKLDVPTGTNRIVEFSQNGKMVSCSDDTKIDRLLEIVYPPETLRKDSPQ